MSANLHRRGLLGLFAAAPVVAAAGMEPASAIGRARSLVLSGQINALKTASQAEVEEMMRGVGLRHVDAALERANPLDPEPARLTELVERIGTDPDPVLAQTTAQAHAIAALALVFPPEIAAYRSFGAPMRRRLYAELLQRQSRHVIAAQLDRGSR